MGRKCTVLVLSLLLVVFILFGCATPGAAPGGTQPPGGNPPAGNAPAGGNNQSPGKAVEMPSKTITLATNENAIRMDPHRDNNAGSRTIKDSVFEVLFWNDHQGSFYPMLAENWEWSEDWLTLTVYLRQGVKFHNGNPFNAADIIANFDRVLNPDDPYMAPWRTDFAAVESYEALDEYTVVFHFNTLDCGLMMNFSALKLMDGESYAELGDAAWEDGRMYGTGSWKFVEWVDGQYARLVKNEDWWNIENNNSYYDTLIVRHILEPTTAVAAHLSGDINGNIPIGGIGKDLLELYKQAADRIQLYTQTEGSYYYLQYGFTQPNSPFHDQNFRYAFEHAIDRQAIIDNIYGGGTLPSTIIIPIALGGQDVQEPRTYDPELAKEYLAKSSYDGYDIELMGNTSTFRGEETLLAVADYCRKVGINAHVKMEEYASFNERRNTKNYDLFLIITIANDCELVGITRQRILEDRQGSSFVDEHLNEIIRNAIKTMQRGPRDDIFREMSKYMYEIAAPHFALVQCDSTYAWDNGVSGLVLYLDGTQRFSYVTYNPDVPEGVQSVVMPGMENLKKQ